MDEDGKWQILDAIKDGQGSRHVCRRLASLKHINMPIPEQAIDVPKISNPASSSRRCRLRGVCMVPLEHQMAEQLVQVPMIVSFSSLHGLVEQNVDIPVPHGRGDRGGGRGLQGLRPGQNSTAFGGEHVDIPVPRGGGFRGFLFPERGFYCFIFTLTLRFSQGFSHFSRPEKRRCELES